MIELRDIRKTYSDGHVALSGVDLSLGEGMFGLLGPNGAGKTTFLSILVLGIEPTSGERRYDGLDPRDSRARGAIRKAIGFLPQDFQPIRHLTGFEYLLHCARLRGVPLRAAARAPRAACSSKRSISRTRRIASPASTPAACAAASASPRR